MSVIITESGMRFGSFNEEDIFLIEKSQLYKSLGGNIKAVEFVLCHQNTICFIEAKSSSPKPHNNEDFNPFVLELYEKFAHSIELFFSTILKRKEDKGGEMPRCFHEAEYARVEVKLILVINGHKIEWLTPISDELKRKLKRQIKTWNVEVIVLNHQLAYENQLIIELP